MADDLSRAFNNLDISVKDTSGKEEVITQLPSRQSKFLMTVSTNFRPRTTEQSKEVASHLRGAFNSLFERNSMARSIRFNSGSLDDIENIDAEFSVELGRQANGKRIHGHAIITINHNANIHLNIPEIKGIMLDNIPDHRVKNLYINVRLLPSDFDARAYIRKMGYNPSQFDDAGADDGN